MRMHPDMNLWRRYGWVREELNRWIVIVWWNEVTWSMHTTSVSPPCATDTHLGWRSIFTKFEALENTHSKSHKLVNHPCESEINHYHLSYKQNIYNTDKMPRLLMISVFPKWLLNSWHLLPTTKRHKLIYIYIYKTCLPSPDKQINIRKILRWTCDPV